MPRHQSIRHQNARQPNYYRILGVSLAAGQQEIRRAYRALAKDYHPDRVPEERREWARTQMARINAAYEVLGNPARRSQYDRRQGYLSEADPRAATEPASLAWRPRWHAARHTHRARERARRASAERRRALVRIGAAALGIVLLAMLVWFRWLGLDTPLGRCVWAIVLFTGALLVVVALRLTEL